MESIGAKCVEGNLSMSIRIISDLLGRFGTLFQGVAVGICVGFVGFEW